MLVKHAGTGGKCPAEHSAERRELQSCNKQACVGDERCYSKQDVVLTLDGTSSLTSADYSSVRTLAQAIASKYNNTAYGNDAGVIGAVEFGNGVLNADGSMNQPQSIIELSANSQRALDAIDKTKVLDGVNNIPQALGFAERMLTMAGRKDAEHIVVIISASEPPFKQQAADQVRKLRSAGIRTFVVAITSNVNNQKAKSLRQLASFPRRANFVHVPGFKALKANMTYYTQRILARACARTESPSVVSQRFKRQGFRLVKERHTCGGAGRILLRRFVANAADCAQAAREAPAKYFTFGVGVRSGECWREVADDSSCNPRGFVAASFDFYEVTGLPQPS